VRIRLHHITTKRSGARAVREEVIEAEVVTIGRSTSSVIQAPDLTAALNHASIHFNNGTCWVQTDDGDSMRVDGKLAARQNLVPGSVVRIASRQLTVVQAKSVAGEDPEDFGIELETIAAPASKDKTQQERLTLTIERGLLSRRPLAWLGVIAVLGLFLVVPLLQPKQDLSDGFVEPSVETAEWRQTLALSWLSGPMRPSHSHFGDHCTVCHSEPFKPVADDNCRHCHNQEGPHTGTLRVIQGHAKAPCADCHSEHEPSAAATIRGDELCTSCHTDLKQHSPDSTFVDISDFSSSHGPFRATLPPDANGIALRKVYGDEDPAGPQATLTPPTGLAFSHKVHLKEGLRGPEGKVTLNCASCHDMDQRGIGMQGLTFENSCRGCHSLGFDTDNPDRQVQHGVPLAVERELFEFYAGRALRKAGGAGFIVAARRRPGHEAAADLDDDSLRVVSEQTRISTKRLLGVDGVCDECHRIDESEGASAKVIAPVRIGPFEEAARWLPLTTFGHASHVSVECETCHDAHSAENAETLILPQITACRSCHAGEGAKLGYVASPCTLCHDFHHTEDRFDASRRTASVPPAGVTPGDSP
jgi:predicted CXXCH cytochrome family protein